MTEYSVSKFLKNIAFYSKKKMNNILQVWLRNLRNLSKFLKTRTLAAS